MTVQELAWLLSNNITRPPPTPQETLRGESGVRRKGANSTGDCGGRLRGQGYVQVEDSCGRTWIPSDRVTWGRFSLVGQPRWRAGCTRARGGGGGEVFRFALGPLGLFGRASRLGRCEVGGRRCGPAGGDEGRRRNGQEAAAATAAVDLGGGRRRDHRGCGTVGGAVGGYMQLRQGEERSETPGTSARWETRAVLVFKAGPSAVRSSSTGVSRRVCKSARALTSSTAV